MSLFLPADFISVPCSHKILLLPVPTACCLFSCLLLNCTLHLSSKLIYFLFCRHNAVHGGWSSWSGWTTCSQSCATGSQERSRTCTSPPPRYGGNYCLGNAREKQLCNKQRCPGKKRNRVLSLFLIHYPFFVHFSKICFLLISIGKLCITLRLNLSRN